MMKLEEIRAPGLFKLTNFLFESLNRFLRAPGRSPKVVLTNLASFKISSTFSRPSFRSFQFEFEILSIRASVIFEL